MNKTEQGEPIDAVSRWMDISIEFLEMVKLLSSVAPEQVEAIAASRRDYIRMIHTIIETGDKKTLDAVMRFHAFSIRDIATMVNICYRTATIEEKRSSSLSKSGGDL